MHPWAGCCLHKTNKKAETKNTNRENKTKTNTNPLHPSTKKRKNNDKNTKKRTKTKKNHDKDKLCSPFGEALLTNGFVQQRNAKT